MVQRTEYTLLKPLTGASARDESDDPLSDRHLQQTQKMGKATANKAVQQRSEGAEISTTDPSQSPEEADVQEISPTTGTTRTLSRISTTSTVTYKVYKRRFYGLVVLVLLNIVVSWDWIAFAPVSSTSAKYFNTSEANINWVSTAFLFAFCVATPPTFYVLHKHGPKAAIIITAVLLLIGNWIKYGATRANSFPGVMVGQLIIGFAQPFVLSTATSYSNLWFSPAGRTTATALASLSNPFGAALGQLISPFWANKPSDIPNMILYISIISSAACLPAFFVPAKPPTPPSAGSVPDHMDRASLRKDMHILSRSLEFYLLFIPFIVYVGFFNAFSSLLNQILEPYGFSETDAGIAGAVLIVVGLVCSAISSPFIDRYKFYLVYIKAAIPVLGIFYLIFIWAPQTHSIAYVDLVCAVLGAASFGLVPVALEFLVEIHYPLGPELGTSLCWCGGQLLGGIFIVVMNALKNGKDADPPLGMKRALIFQAVLGLAVVPLPLCLGLFGRAGRVRRLRWEADRNSVGTVDTVVDGAYHDELPVDVEPVAPARGV
ncbi:FLVCR family MFS transporter [Exophiala viscosa]|uniref:FLVCR family MFS transporter n=1 Tax=Exophiala viscosa TaxID=2486360 RepID=A0AAN6DWW2_9EURO|nr:FLVCR family MFS transporter [Exophiala viscosa]KAI1626130.1 FLVCR family MFS transporter [Exophiala viscosa]